MWCLNGEPNHSFRFFFWLNQFSSLNRFFPTVRISLFAFDNVGDYCCLLILLHLNDCDWASFLCLFREKRSVENIKIFYCIVGFTLKFLNSIGCLVYKCFFCLWCESSSKIQIYCHNIKICLNLYGGGSFCQWSSEYKSHIQMILLSLCSRVSLYRLYCDTDSVSQIW